MGRIIGPEEPLGEVYFPTALRPLRADLLSALQNLGYHRPAAAKGKPFRDWRATWRVAGV